MKEQTLYGGLTTSGTIPHPMGYNQKLCGQDLNQPPPPSQNSLEKECAGLHQGLGELNEAISALDGKLTPILNQAEPRPSNPPPPPLGVPALDFVREACYKVSTAVEHVNSIIGRLAL